MAQVLKYPDIISLAAGFVDNTTLPIDSWAEATQAVLSDQKLLRRSLQYDSTSGSAALRDTLIHWSYGGDSVGRPSADQVIVGAGSNQLLHLLAETLLNPGDIVLAAAPTYFVFMGTLAAMGARVVSVKADADGMCMDDLQATLDRLVAAGHAHKVKFIYLVTDFDNPSSSMLSLARRQRLLEIVERWRIQHGPMLIFSDNAYQHLRFSGQPIDPLMTMSAESSDYVVDFGTFSKSYSPGVRVGWCVAPSQIVAYVLGLKSSIDFGSPHFSQVVMNHVLTSGAWHKHQPQLLANYKSKLDSMLSALDRFASQIPGVTWRKPNGGLYVWLTLPEHIDAGEEGPLWQAATDRGVIYVPGHYCFAAEGQPVQRNTLRLSFGVLPECQIADAIERLSGAISSVCAG
jgi:2-aminoadipate transaminase